MDTARVQYIGHASFLITAPDGTRLVIDPYQELSYPFPTGIRADAVVVTHTQHADHYNIQAVEGDPVIITEKHPQQVGMIRLWGYPSKHGSYGEWDLGDNTIFVFQIGDARLVHLGELGKIEDGTIYEAISDADVVMVPVGATASLAVKEIMPLLERIRARTIVPQHYAPDENHRYYGALTVAEFLETAQPQMPVVDLDELRVEPNMPVQIAILPLWETIRLAESL